VPPLTALPVVLPDEPLALGELPRLVPLLSVGPIELPVPDGALCALGELLWDWLLEDCA
jgi:hypothetical protein